MKPARFAPWMTPSVEQMTDLEGNGARCASSRRWANSLDTSRIGQIRKDIARIKTVQTEREIEAELASLVGAGAE
jgi:hypothetical protein